MGGQGSQRSVHQYDAGGAGKIWTQHLLCRPLCALSAAVRKRADNQDPQFESYRGFRAYGGFLGSKTSQAARRYSVCFVDDHWRVNCGALHGLPSDPDNIVELALYAESDRSQLIGHAATTRVAPQESELELLDMDADPSARFQAEITSLPLPPLAVYLEGDAKGTKSFLEFLNASEDHSLGVALLSEAAEGTRYALLAENNRYLLKLRETGRLIQGAKGYTHASANYMFAILKQVAGWERTVGLQNHSTKMDRDCVRFRFSEVLGDDRRHEFPDGEITLDIDDESNVQCTLTANNLSHQPLHLLLVHFAEDYCIQSLYNERVERTESDFTVTLDGNAIFDLTLDDDEGDEAVHTFKLIVSTEKVDEFLLEQDPLELGAVVDPSATRGLSFGRSRKKMVHKNEWFTKDIHVKLVRQLDRVTAKDTTIANRQITIKGHPSLQAGVSLSAAKTATRGVGTGSDIYRVMERQGMQMLSFSSSRGDDDAENILELTDIQNPEVLREQPLEIVLDVDLAEDEFILPLAFDGEHILLTGDPTRDEEGKTHISIDHIPDIPDNRRSLGSAAEALLFQDLSAARKC